MDFFIVFAPPWICYSRSQFTVVEVFQTGPNDYCTTTLAIAMIYLFVAICTTLLQRKRLLYTTEHIRGDIDGLLQP